MAKRTDAIPADRRVTLVAGNNGEVHAEYVWKRYRFLLDDGTTLDVLAIQDDSDLRAAILEEHVRGHAIVGVARVPEEPNGPDPTRPDSD